MKNLASNNRAKYDFQIIETIDAGLVLNGSEVKSVKAGHVSLNGSYILIHPKGAKLINTHISPYQYGTVDNYQPTRIRSLLLTKTQINSLLSKDKGLSIIPLGLFEVSRGLIKLRIGLARGRKKQDKRDYLKKREAQKEIRSSSTI